MRQILTLALLLGITPIVLTAAPVTAQVVGEAESWEVVLLGSWAWDGPGGFDLDVAGAQFERQMQDHLALWASFRRVGLFDSCLLSGDRSCGSGGWSTYLGVSIEPWTFKEIVPYLSVGGGLLRWENGDIDAMWEVRPGLSLVGFGRFRPRLEVGYERFSGAGVTLGLGIGF